MRAAPGRLDGVSCEERRAPQLAWEQPIIQGLPSWLGRPLAAAGPRGGSRDWGGRRSTSCDAGLSLEALEDMSPLLTSRPSPSLPPRGEGGRPRQPPASPRPRGGTRPSSVLLRRDPDCAASTAAGP